MTILCRKGRQAGITFRVLALLQCRGQIIIDKILRQRKRKVFHRHRPQRGGQVGLRLPETVFRRSGSLLVCIFIPTIIELARSFQLPLLRETVFIPQLSEIVSVVKPLGRIRVVIHHTAGQSATGIEQIPFHIQILAFRQTGKKIHLRTVCPDVAIVTPPFYRLGQVHHRKMIIPVGTQIFSVKRTRQTRCEPMGIEQ